MYCLYFPCLSVSTLFNCSITLSKSTWPNVDSLIVIMGDDSSKNNNQIYYLIKFSLFLLCHVTITHKKIKKGNIPSGCVVKLLLTLFLGTSGSLSQQSSCMKDILEKCHLQKNFSSRNCLHLKKNHSIKVILICYLNQRIFNEIILRWRVYFFFFLRV